MRDAGQRCLGKLPDTHPGGKRLKPQRFRRLLDAKQGDALRSGKAKPDKDSQEWSLPWYLHIICKQAMPHCMESCWRTMGNFLLPVMLLLLSYIYNGH